MEQIAHKTGIIVPCWERLCADTQALERFIKAVQTLDEHIIILSMRPCSQSSVFLRPHIKTSYLTDIRYLSPARLGRLCAQIFKYDQGVLTPQKMPNTPPAPQAARFGFVVSNGFGLGHVMRSLSLAQGLKDFGACGFLSFSAGLQSHATASVRHIGSAQYLGLDDAQALSYTRAEALRFISDFVPTHLIYDGNVIPSGLLAALSLHPNIHFSWVRRGMWRPQTADKYMAQQALADLAIEPGDLAEAQDTGPSWQKRYDFCAAGAFLKTPPIKPQFNNTPHLTREQALKKLGLRVDKKHILLMPGATQSPEDAHFVNRAISALRHIEGIEPVLAHWPISHQRPPVLGGIKVIEQMPLAPYYPAFEVIVSAAGYNSYHEILASAAKCVFVPQDDVLRDQQVVRAQYATQNKHTLMCDRKKINQLSSIVKQALEQDRTSLPDIAWLNDWDELVRYMGVCNKKAVHPAKKPCLIRQTIRRAQLKGLFIKAHRKTNEPHTQAHNSGRGRFVLALGMGQKAFLRRYTPQREDIIVSDKLDAIFLRRQGCKYINLGPELAPKNYATKRLIMSYLQVWAGKDLLVL